MWGSATRASSGPSASIRARCAQARPRPFFFWLLDEPDLGRSLNCSDAGWRKPSEPASPKVEAPRRDKPVAGNTWRATCGTSAKTCVA